MATLILYKDDLKNYNNDLVVINNVLISTGHGFDVLYHNDENEVNSELEFKEE